MIARFTRASTEIPSERLISRSLFTLRFGTKYCWRTSVLVFEVTSIPTSHQSMVKSRLFPAGLTHKAIRQVFVPPSR